MRGFDERGYHRKKKKSFRVRNVDEITSATMHHSIRPSLPDLKSQKS